MRQGSSLNHFVGEQLHRVGHSMPSALAVCRLITNSEFFRLTMAIIGFSP